MAWVTNIFWKILQFLRLLPNPKTPWINMVGLIFWMLLVSSAGTYMILYDFYLCEKCHRISFSKLLAIMSLDFLHPLQGLLGRVPNRFLIAHNDAQHNAFFATAANFVEHPAHPPST